MKALSICLLTAAVSLGADPSGRWHLIVNRFGEDTMHVRLELKTDGSKLTGRMMDRNELKIEGSVSGDVLKLKVLRPNGSTAVELDGSMSGNEMHGIAKDGDQQHTWKAARLEEYSGAPRTHTFEPQKFHRLFSGAIEPVLHIAPGDTVQTSTVDAGGRDAKNAQRSLGGNPQTGPFFIDGAFPGDTLAVKFNRIRLNRDSAGSGDSIVSSALTPNYLRNAKMDEKFDSSWKLDREKGVAMLAKPTERLKNFTVKMAPMLGCVAVAPPANQAFRTGFPGSFGGNMDYNGLREGVTVYLPVSAVGALLYIGDGHAAEGDGELNGDALETSMAVEFTVNLIRGQATQGPRMEDDQWIMASGIANSLPEALQVATTELARWIERDYKLSANESAIVLGTSVRYDIAEVVDPLVHIVAKLNKEALAGLK